MSRIVFLTVAIFAVLIFASSLSPDDAVRAEVVRVVDGDTVIVHVNDTGTDERVRMLNLDTPEVSASTAQERCFAEEAKVYVSSRLPVGTEVQLATDRVERDRYERLLAGIQPDESDRVIQIDIAARGLGVAAYYGDNDRYLNDVESAERSAKREKAGMWDPNHHCHRATDSG